MLMINAYDKVYLEKARTNLARMLDFAVYDLKYDISDFFELFITSGVADRFENGDFNVLVGMSGVELAYEVLEKSNASFDRIKPNYTVNRSEEYWTGWALAYYQWGTSLSFKEIVHYIPIKEIQALYSTYHEMDIRQFVDKMNSLSRKLILNFCVKKQDLVNESLPNYLVYQCVLFSNMNRGKRVSIRLRPSILWLCLRCFVVK